jgi:hypothetical protein
VRTSLRPAIALAILAVAGCGGPKYSFADVEGTVAYEGQPLAGVVVTFYPDSESNEQQPYSRGTTDETGHYTLTRTDGKPGALVGRHRVVVNWPPPERREDGTRPPPPSPAIPVLYTVVLDTPLRADVQAGPRQTVDLSLHR